MLPFKLEFVAGALFGGGIRSTGVPAALLAGFLITFPSAPSRAVELEASDGFDDDEFGRAVSLWGDTALVGAYQVSDERGAAYLFRDLDAAPGTVAENAKLSVSDGVPSDRFGRVVSLWGDTALIGAYHSFDEEGAAYVFTGLNAASGTIPESVRLIASDAAEGDEFGWSVSLWENIALVGAHGHDTGGLSLSGAVYLFRDVDKAAGTEPLTESAKLVASDGAEMDVFGAAVSLRGGIAVVGAQGRATNGFSASGAAYVFRNLDDPARDSGLVTEKAKLIASDAAEYDQFGVSVSLSGATAVVGAYMASSNGVSDTGTAYVFRGVDEATGTVLEDVKLTASDAAEYDQFGRSVSLSGANALVGAPEADPDGIEEAGAAYLFTGLDTASGTIVETVKLTASGGADNHQFGASVSLDGGRFLIGERQGDGRATNTGKAYFGRVSAFTTLDEGNGVVRATGGLSFVSRADWIAGDSTGGNTLVLSAGDSADVTAPGMAVHVGRGAGSDDNLLRIEGTLCAGEIYIGSLEEGGSLGNVFEVGETGTLEGDPLLRLLSGNFLSLEGDYTEDFGDLLARLGGAELQVRGGGDAWETVTELNHGWFVDRSFADGRTLVWAVTPVPEPGTAGLALLAATSWFARRGRRR